MADGRCNVAYCTQKNEEAVAAIEIYANPIQKIGGSVDHSTAARFLAEMADK